jgi:hypothetical protein
MKIARTCTAAACLAAAFIALPGAPAARAAVSALSASAATQGIQSCHSQVSVLAIIEIDQTIAPEGTATGSIYAKVPFVGRVRLADFSGNLHDGITTPINVAVASGSITLGASSYNGTDWETINADLNIKFFGKVNTGGPVRLIPICGS